MAEFDAADRRRLESVADAEPLVAANKERSVVVDELVEIVPTPVAVVGFAIVAAIAVE